MSNNLLDKSKRIKYDLQNAKSQVDSIIKLLDSSFVVNDNYYIQKDEIVHLNNKLSNMINTLNSHVISLVDK